MYKAFFPEIKVTEPLTLSINPKSIVFFKKGNQSMHMKTLYSKSLNWVESISFCFCLFLRLCILFDFSPEDCQFDRNQTYFSSLNL